MSKSFKKEQNSFRGIISKYKAKGFHPKASRTPLSCLRSDVKSQLLEARENLHPNQFSDFLRWTKSQLKLVPEMEGSPVDYDDLWGVIRNKSELSIENELIWVSERLSLEVDKINSYLADKDKIENLIFENKATEAINIQDAQFKKIGASMCGVQIRLALENLGGGIDSQKKYSSHIRSIYKNGLLRFIGFYASMRNEPQSNIVNYLSTVKSRIRIQKNYDDNVKTYLRFQLTYDFDYTRKELADILCIEQSHSIIDIYETFLRIITLLLDAEINNATKSYIKSAIDNISQINDSRILKISGILGVKGKSLNTSINTAGECLLSNKPIESVRYYRDEIKHQEGVSPWTIIYSSIALSQVESTRIIDFVPRNLPNLLGRVLSLGSQDGASFDKIKKLLLNFRTLPSIDGVFVFLSLLTDQLKYSTINISGICINTRDNGPEDGQCFDGSISDRYLLSEGWSRFYDPNGASALDMEVERKLDIFKSFGLFRQASYQESLSFLDKFESNFGLVRAITNSLRIRIFVESDERQQVVEFITDECIFDDARSNSISIEYAFENLVREDFRDFTGLVPLIALHLIWRNSKSAENASNLRINIRRTLKNYGVDFPSQLNTDENVFKTHHLIYFLREVCSLEFIDQIRSINSTMELLNERQNICHALRTLDRTNASDYEEEIAEIDYKKSLEEGEWIVDRTRIHVDSDALQRWCKENMSEDFLRYKNLLQLDTRPEEDISQYLKEIFSGQISENLLDFPINSEGDQLLLTMVMEISEQFLTNPSFGLDFHLSKRIRHQSFIGLIRGPVETCGIITTKPTKDSEYNSNRTFLKLFEKLDHKSKEHIDRAFKAFSKNFDERLTEAKDSHFQIYSPKQHPRGLIKLNLVNAHIRLIQELSKGATDIAEFTETVEMVFWGTLEPSLKQARNFISNDLNHSLRKTFDELRGQVASRADQESDAYQSFANSLSEGYKGASHMLENACGWFTRLSRDYATQALKLKDMLDIAVNSSMKAATGLEPDIHFDICDQDTYMDARNTVLIHDVIFVAFGNIYKHSGIMKPKVIVRASVDIMSEIFSISVENNVKPGVRKTSEPRLNEIKKHISERSYGNLTRKESRSGLIKLAAGAHQHTKGKVEAEFVDDFNYRMSVDYHLILRPKSGESNNEVEASTVS